MNTLYGVRWNIGSGMLDTMCICMGCMGSWVQPVDETDVEIDKRLEVLNLRLGVQLGARQAEGYRGMDPLHWRFGRLDRSI